MAPNASGTVETQRNATPWQGTDASQENFSDYVAELQLHMTLQARNLVPSIHQQSDSRTALLHETQAMMERHISRQL